MLFLTQLSSTSPQYWATSLQSLLCLSSEFYLWFWCHFWFLWRKQPYIGVLNAWIRFKRIPNLASHRLMTRFLPTNLALLASFWRGRPSCFVSWWLLHVLAFMFSYLLRNKLCITVSVYHFHKVLRLYSFDTNTWLKLLLYIVTISNITWPQYLSYCGYEAF